MKNLDKYILIHNTEEGDSFIYNSITRSSVILPKSLNIKNIEDIENISDEEILNMLKENLIILDDTIDYLRLGRYVSNKSKYYNRVLTITDAVTFNCNLRCAYCMEQNRGNVFDVKYMNIDERINIWKRLYELSNLENMRVIFFGGEPFFNIKYVADLIEAAKKENLPIVSYSAVTNGTRCNDEFIDLLNKYPFKQLQITLDGTRDIHDKRRIDQANNGTWDKIMNNIERILNETDVSIVVNSVIDKENSKSHEELIDILAERFPKYMFGEKSRIIFNIGMECSPEGACEFTDKNIPDRVEYIDVYMPALKRAIQKNVKINNFIPTPVCIYNAEQELIIAPDGDIYINVYLQ
ncbi:radical SAM protein [Clostridium faecium]